MKTNLVLISTLLCLLENLFIITAKNNNLISNITVGIARELQFSSKLSPNLVLYVALRVLQWPHFTILCKNSLEEKLLQQSWTRNEDVEFLRNFHKAKIEIVNIGNLHSPCSLEKNRVYRGKTNYADSSCTKLNFVSFLEPAEISQLITNKMPNLRLHSWLIISLLNSSEWEEGMNSFNLTLNSDVFLASIISPDQQFLKVYEFYKIYHNYPLKVLEMCTVGLNGILIGSNYLEHKYQRRKNLENFHLRVVGLDLADYFLNTSRGIDGNIQIQGGLLAELFLSICQEANISFSLQILKGYNFGSFINGSWNGMIGFLSRNEVDMSCSEISMVSDRLAYIEFTNSFMTVGRRIYIRRTFAKKTINWLFFTNPFSPFLLLSVAICFVILIGVLWISILIYKRKSETNEVNNIHEVIWMVFCALCQKGAPVIPTSRSAKLIFVIIYVTFLIIYTSYSATLTSQLTVAPPLQLPFNDLNGLLESDGWSGGPIKGDLTQIYMEKTCPEILNRSKKRENIECELLVNIWEKIVVPKVQELPSNFGEGLTKVLKEQFAFVASSTGVRNEINTGLLEENVCRVHELDGQHVSSNIAFGLKKNFPMKGLINYKLLQLHQFGILSRLKNIWLPKLNKDCGLTENYVQISIADFALAPILVLISIVCSSLIFIFELRFRSNSESTIELGSSNLSLNCKLKF